MKRTNLLDTESLLGYTFTRPELLSQALSHRSYSAQHNERLEFIGDSVLNCVVAYALYEHFPDLNEGDLSRIRARLVNRETLTRLALDLDLPTYLKLGDGELKSGGAQRASILADAMEAIFGAVLVDAGFATAQEVIRKVYGDTLRDADPERLGKDAKTRLQEWLQGQREPLPRYTVTSVKGEAHEQHFVVECQVKALPEPVLGEGSSRRTAEQHAAEKALALLLELMPPKRRETTARSRRRLSR